MICRPQRDHDRPARSRQDLAGARHAWHLPEMSIDEALDVTRIYAVADAPPTEMIVRTRPFSAPYHTISHAGLVGGGNWPHPGEISLAHRVLKLASTIADLAGCESIQAAHLAEALQYRAMMM